MPSHERISPTPCKRHSGLRTFDHLPKRDSGARHGDPVHSIVSTDCGVATRVMSSERRTILFSATLPPADAGGRQSAGGKPVKRLSDGSGAAQEHRVAGVA